MTQWKYYVEVIQQQGLTERLNVLGQDGWNLVTSSYSANVMTAPGQWGNQFICIFKQPIPEPKKPVITG